MDDVTPRLREFWDADAEVYDRTTSHAGTDPAEAGAWRRALLRSLPPPGASILDVGAGTGTMSLLAAQLGYRVTALDLSPKMLERAREKAEAVGLKIAFVVAPADEPPAGPFDAVIERHVLWTIPDPVGALRTWRDVMVPDGRLALFETLVSDGPYQAIREAAAAALRKAMGVPADHHANYGGDLLARLPLSRMTHPGPVAAAATEAGWCRIRTARLRGVERTRLRASPPVVGRLEHAVRYALIADA